MKVRADELRPGDLLAEPPFFGQERVILSVEPWVELRTAGAASVRPADSLVEIEERSDPPVSQEGTPK